MSLVGQTKFIIQQTDKNMIDLDTLAVRSILNNNKGGIYDYEVTPFGCLKTAKQYEYGKHDIPVGDLKFVSLFLSKFCGVDKMNPIEVPLELQRYDVVKRNYNIVKGSELPESGHYFVKDASHLKNFSYQGELRYLNIKKSGDIQNYSDRSAYIIDSTLRIDPDNLYQLSELVDFISEYRCFIKDGKVLGIQYYIGDPLVTLSESMINELISWVKVYSSSEYAPKSYSMDVGILEKDGTKQLALIEIHPITSLGLYGFYDLSLPKMYKDGIEWYINVNRGVSECKISK